MPTLARFRALDLQTQAIVAIGVLLDGESAPFYLQSDKVQQVVLAKAAADLLQLPADLRVPYLGTVLRGAIESLGSA